MASHQFDGYPARSPTGVMSPRRPRSRTQSISSDKPSTVGHGLVSIPIAVSPQPAFIATSAASQIVTNDHDSHADAWYDESGMIPAGETALISDSALQLVNNFLDQLLFNFLQQSKATTLSALRPAVTEVLKPKLAKDAINNADEELHEYLGGADEEDYVLPQGADPSRDWDLELVWKRTRLRCMVYSSLGDMEEEDEDLYMEQENLEIGADEHISDVISPAVAIFLTSVLEYMGELTLTVAGQAAYHRVRANFEKEIKDGSRTMADIADRIVVEEGDMERVALDRTLGRLWRGWKKRIRTPSTLDLGTRSFSRASFTHLRQDSTSLDGPAGHHSPAAIEEADKDREGEEAKAPAKVEETPKEPANVPLPLGQNDVNEIEVPGLAYHSDDEDEADEVDASPARPKSLLIKADSETLGHKRAVSLPVAARSKFSIPVPAPVSAQTDPVSDLEDSDSVYDERIEDTISAQTTPGDEQAETLATQASGQDQRKKSSMTIANTAFGPLVKNQETRPAPQQPTTQDEEEMTTTYEKAEIMTSARVSVASSSPSSNEGGVKRSTSVRSARIVDVPGPKSPHTSRSPSMDVSVRSSSATRANGSSTPPIAEETDKSKRQEVSTRSNGIPAPTQMSARITGFEDAEPDLSALTEDDDEPQKRHSPAISQTGIAASGSDGSLRNGGRHVPQTQTARNPQPSSRQQSLPSNNKLSIHTGHYTNGFIDEPIPEVPVRAAGHTPRTSSHPNSASKASLDRPRHRESDDIPSPLPGQAGAPMRPSHAPASSISSANGRIKAVRTSEDNSRAENVARNFEELIQSDQTITYTLTPENMRDMDSPRSIDSPKFSRFTRNKAEEPQVQERSRSSSATDFKSAPASQRMVSGGPSVAHDRRGQHAAPAVAGSPISISKSSGLHYPGSTGSPVDGPRSSKVPAALARDARVPADSVADMAQFIKATGPAGETRSPPVRSGHSANSPSLQKISSDSHRASVNSSRNRYQPREAAADGAAENRDLIDFIRQGPPPNGLQMNRPVPTFREDSHSKLLPVPAGRSLEASIPEVRHSQASTSATEYSGPSMQSSIHSNTALLKNKGPSLPKMMDEDDMMPKRKTRRVRDPYAIDFSDEEDEELFAPHNAPPKPPVKREESLAEFLQNYEPPPEPEAPPQKIPKKKASAPSLMHRFRSRESKDVKASKSSKNVLKNGAPSGESRSLSSRTGPAVPSKGGHIPIQISMPPGYNEYGLMDNGSAGQPRVTAASPSGPSRRVPMKKFEPRDATPQLSRSSTAELAAFLRDSEPPPSAMVPASLPSPTSAEPSGFSRFVRRKKPIV